MRTTRYELVSLIITVASLVIVVLAETSIASALIGNVPVLTILITLDTLACVFFITEWIIELSRAENKLTYASSHIIHLLGAVPFVSTLRWLRVLRIIRIFRLVRLGIHVMSLWKAWTIRLISNPFTTLGVPALVVLILSATAFYEFEAGTNEQIHHYTDALWWASVTITTIGYGDVYPITIGGRVTSLFTMLFGIGLIGSFTAAVASTILRGPDPTGPDLQDVLLKLDEVERQQSTILKALRHNQ